VLGCERGADSAATGCAYVTHALTVPGLWPTHKRRKGTTQRRLTALDEEAGVRRGVRGVAGERVQWAPGCGAERA
jgi:hypothetical protein